MEIVQWLWPESWGKAAHALVRVGAGEKADREAMLRLVDNGMPNFGHHIKLCKVGDPNPRLARKVITNMEVFNVQYQSDLPSEELVTDSQVRFYEVVVYRD
jgi:hypothetical protein